MTAPLTPAQVLRNAKALISDPAKWTQGAAARDAGGNAVSATSPTGVCWCMVGSVLLTTSISPNLRVSAGRLLGKACDGELVNRFNDTHTHAEVMAAFDRAIELAEAGQ